MQYKAIELFHAATYIWHLLDTGQIFPLDLNNIRIVSTNSIVQGLLKTLGFADKYGQKNTAEEPDPIDSLFIPLF